MNIENEMMRSKVEGTEKWREWCRKIPALHFKEKWNVYVIPPFGGALTRIRIEYNGKYVSVYFDAYDQLGCMGQPYWEMYDGNGITRFYMDDTDGLMKEIEIALS